MILFRGQSFGAESWIFVVLDSRMSVWGNKIHNAPGAVQCGCHPHHLFDNSLIINKF